MPRILLIDDNAPFRGMLQKVLEHAGYEVETASNGKTGLKLYRENPSDLIITDLVMPEKEGLETIMELRRTTPCVKILAISGGGRLKPHVNLVMAEKLGAAKSVAKPFSHQEILDAVAEILKRGEK
jgi:DNA-binding response OmpR family regulator